MRVLPRENEEVNECWISDKDRFSYEALNVGDRLQKPMIRVDGALREVEWNVALDYVSHGLKDIAAQHGGEQIASLAAPNATLEEIYLLQKLTRGLGSGNVDFRPRRRDFSADGQLAGTPWLGLRLAQINELDAALVVGSFCARIIHYLPSGCANWPRNRAKSVLFLSPMMIPDQAACAHYRAAGRIVARTGRHCKSYGSAQERHTAGGPRIRRAQCSKYSHC